MTLDTHAHYRVDGWGRGIAWYTLGHPEVHGEDGDSEVLTEYARMVMVGDDREFVVPVEDLTVIPDDGFCRECGQIGCGHNVYT